MLITDVRQLRKGLCQLYLDGEAAVKVDKEVFVLSPFKMGSQISDEELYELIQKSDSRRAREKALYLLEHRSHSKKELKEKLMAAVPKEAAEEAAEHMEKIGLVNDEEFARMYTRDLVERKKLGPGRVRMELLRKGIDKELVDELIEEHTGGEEETILALLRRKYPLWQEDEGVKRRAVAAMQRMGYRWDQIRRAIKEAEIDE